MREASRKSRGEGEGVNLSPESSTDTLEEMTFPFVQRNRNGKQNCVSPGIPDPLMPLSPSQRPADLELGRHVPHFICWFLERPWWRDYQLMELTDQTQGQRIKREDRQRSTANTSAPLPLCNMTSTVQQLLGSAFEESGPTHPSQPPKGCLPHFIRPLPARLMSLDIDYLHAKGALTIPDFELRNELLKSYI